MSVCVKHGTKRGWLAGRRLTGPGVSSANLPSSWADVNRKAPAAASAFRTYSTFSIVTTTNNMASILGRSAFRATRVLRSAGPTAGGESAASAKSKDQQKSMLQGAAKKDPELYVRRVHWTTAHGPPLTVPHRSYSSSCPAHSVLLDTTLVTFSFINLALSRIPSPTRLIQRNCSPQAYILLIRTARFNGSRLRALELRNYRQIPVSPWR